MAQYTAAVGRIHFHFFRNRGCLQRRPRKKIAHDGLEVTTAEAPFRPKRKEPRLRITEPSTAAGYGVYDLQTRAFAPDLCRFWNVPERVLPRLLPANSLAGPLSEAGATLLGLAAGIPVSTGAADSVSSSYSMAGLD